MTDILSPATRTALILLFIVALLVFVGIVIVRILRKRSGMRALKTMQSGGGDSLPGPWRGLRDEVEASNRNLSRSVFEIARRIFLDYYTTGVITPGALTPEYEREEFLQVVDEDGRPSILPPELLDAYHRTTAVHPTFAHWFQEVTLPDGEFAGSRVLLAARWFCHLVGLRHVTVQTFIDPPELTGHTLVQVRGMDKFLAPGTFDLPCAGHVNGVDSVEETLRKELSEELNLSLDDLDGLFLIGRFNSFGEDTDNGPINYEHGVLYRARLRPEAAARIRFTDGEVAGLTVFSVNELRELVRRYPERVAGGLADMIGMYE